ncbi:MAG TPA: hypothetical protein PLZ51_22735, partial [Aggregatilineales bacterium]|nr:hypothetical protein [Aggregatilineales bacterium]
MVWRNHHYALWKQGSTPPSENATRIHSREYPHCPNCGTQLTTDEDTRTKDGYLEYLRASKRECGHCHSPLWTELRPKTTQGKNTTYKQVARSWHNYNSSKPRPVITLTNPRYRLDQ